MHERARQCQHKEEDETVNAHRAMQIERDAPQRSTELHLDALERPPKVKTGNHQPDQQQGRDEYNGAARGARDQQAQMQLVNLIEQRGVLRVPIICPVYPLTNTSMPCTGT